MAKTKYLVSKSGEKYLNCKQLRARKSAKGVPTFKPAPHLEDEFETVEAVEVVGAETDSPSEDDLSPQQKAARTRAKNKAKKEAEAKAAAEAEDDSELDDWD